MSFDSLLGAFSAHLMSEQFYQTARDKTCPNAFSRTRKLPLHALVAMLLCGMKKSIQAELGEFFAHLQQQAQLVHHVSAQAFAKARANLAATAIFDLNEWLMNAAEEAQFIQRWHGLRLVAVDASTIKFGIRASRVPNAACADQIAFGMYLPGTEMMLSASLHSIHEGERQMLFQNLDRLCETDLLLLDRGYPCNWLVAVLNQRNIPFCMRVEKSGDNGFTCVRNFLRSGLAEQIVTLNAPKQADAEDYECSGTQKVRLIRNVTSKGTVRVLMVNMLDSKRWPASLFGDLYHQRWRIEEAFKRLKHRLNLEHVSGLSQRAVMQDFAAKILCDNLHTLATTAAHEQAQLAPNVRINRAFVCTVFKPLMPAILFGIEVAEHIQSAFDLIARETSRRKQGISKPRKPGNKPHKFMSQKNS